MIFYGRSILLPSFTTPVFLLRLRCLSEHRQVRVLHKQQSIGEWKNPETQPRFPDGVLSYKKAATNTHKKGRSGYSPFLPFLISFIFFLFSIFRISTASASLPDTYTALPAQTPELPASSAVCHYPPSYVHIPELRHNILPGILYLH